jgi:hypothetical protein
MSTPDTVVKAKLRDDGRIKRLFQAAESRHLTADEYSKYLSYAPHANERSAAAREIENIQLDVVAKTIGYVSVYATHSMLLDDPDWFRDKLLIWLKTILQSFSYPAREDTNSASAKPLPHPEITEHADSLKVKGQRSIYETYSRLIVNYQEVLSPQTFNLIRPHLQLAVDILSSD